MLNNEKKKLIRIENNLRREIDTKAEYFHKFDREKMWPYKIYPASDEDYGIYFQSKENKKDMGYAIASTFLAEFVKGE